MVFLPYTDSPCLICHQRSGKCCSWNLSYCCLLAAVRTTPCCFLGCPMFCFDYQLPHKNRSLYARPRNEQGGDLWSKKRDFWWRRRYIPASARLRLIHKYQPNGCCCFQRSCYSSWLKGMTLLLQVQGGNSSRTYPITCCRVFIIDPRCWWSPRRRRI